MRWSWLLLALVGCSAPVLGEARDRADGVADDGAEDEEGGGGGGQDGGGGDGADSGGGDEEDDGGADPGEADSGDPDDPDDPPVLPRYAQLIRSSPYPRLVLEIDSIVGYGPLAGVPEDV